MVCREVFVEGQPFKDGIGNDPDLIGRPDLVGEEMKSRSFGLLQTLGIVEGEIEEKEKLPV